MKSTKINLKESSIVELKAVAYDLSEEMQRISQTLNVVNQEIQARQAEEAKLSVNRPAPLPTSPFPGAAPEGTEVKYSGETSG